MSALIRAMTPDDVDAVLAIEQAVQAYPWTRGNFSDALNCGYLCFIDELAGEVRGYAVLMPGVGEAELLTIGVALAHQRKGLGRLMLVELLRMAAEKQLSRVFLEVRASNRAAIALYLRAGFAQIGLRRGYYRNAAGSEDALVMACDNFSGEKNGGYVETDPPSGALNVYGRSKSKGEENLKAKKHYLIRTSWLFGKNGKNFVRTMIDLAAKNQELKIVADQIGKPTYTADLAQAVFDLMKDMPEFGIYHLVNEDAVSWCDFAKEIFKIKGIDVKVTPVTSAEFVRPATRPKNSILDNTKRPKLRSHTEALKSYLKEI